MRKLLLFCTLIITASVAFCQTLPVDKATGLITYTEVVKSDSASQKQLYKAAKLWVLSAYNHKYVAQLNDDETFTIVLKPVMEVYQQETADAGSVHYTMILECRNGRYKYTFTGFGHEKIPKTNMCDGGNLENDKYDCPELIMNKKELWADIKKQVNDNVLWLIDDMKESMAANLKIKKSDW